MYDLQVVGTFVGEKKLGWHNRAPLKRLGANFGIQVSTDCSRLL